VSLEVIFKASELKGLQIALLLNLDHETVVPAELITEHNDLWRRSIKNTVLCKQ
jgi:hypothetical protein